MSVRMLRCGIRTKGEVELFLQGRQSLDIRAGEQEREPSVTVTVPRQNIATLSVLVNQRQAARLNRAQDVSPELVSQLIHRLILPSCGILGDKPVTSP